MKFHSIGAPLSTVIFLLLNLNSAAQISNDLWAKTSREDVSKSQLMDRSSEPSDALFYYLDLDALKSVLQNAPQRGSLNAVSNVIVSFPNTEGILVPYRIFEAPVMHPALQSKYPDMHSYVGRGIGNNTGWIRFSVTTFGLHSMTMSSLDGRHFIDPYSKIDNSYIIYAKKDLQGITNEFVCGFIDGIKSQYDNAGQNETSRNANDGILREFRLALASTIEYSEFHWTAAGLTALDPEADKKAAVLAAMVVTMTRVNGIYENDLSITMTLIANNDDVIFVGNSDPYSNDNGASMLSQNQTELDNTIGAANYDIGHVFSTGGGGIAGLGVICLNGSKARGVTGLSSPVGDIFDVDFVSHEMGHQFGANHTFNGNAGRYIGNVNMSLPVYKLKGFVK